MAHLSGFAPVGSTEPRILILGSFPSVRSLELGQYYGHGRNHFWAILGAVVGFDPGAPYEERIAALAGAGIALWDVIASCEREGSLDQDIRAETANPIADFLDDRPGIEKLALNGGKAFSSFARHFAPELRKPGSAIGEIVDWRPSFLPERRISVSRLPSTSPVPTRRYRRAFDKLPPWSFIA
jgi:TDG/mug DNA glycosylase family protein